MTYPDGECRDLSGRPLSRPVDNLAAGPDDPPSNGVQVSFGHRSTASTYVLSRPVLEAPRVTHRRMQVTVEVDEITVEYSCASSESHAGRWRVDTLTLTGQHIRGDGRPAPREEYAARSLSWNLAMLHCDGLPEWVWTFMYNEIPRPFDTTQQLNLARRRVRDDAEHTASGGAGP